MAREPIAAAGDEIEEKVALGADRADGPGSLVRTLDDMVAALLEGSGYRSGCAIATMVLELASAGARIGTIATDASDPDGLGARMRELYLGNGAPVVIVYNTFMELQTGC